MAAGRPWEGDRGTTVVNDLSFAIAPGEVFGIAGVEGNGQTELLEALAEGGILHLFRGDDRVEVRETIGLDRTEGIRDRTHIGHIRP